MSRSEIIQLERTNWGVATGCLRYTAMSGEIAAGLLAGNVIAAWDLASFLPSRSSYIERVRVTVTTLTAFTAPVTAGRALALTRLDAMPAAGGTCYQTVKSTGVATETELMAISTTTPLAGAVPEGSPLWILPLSSVGSAGASRDFELDFGLSAANLEFEPGILGLVALGNFDAAGTIQIVTELDLELEAIEA